MNRIRAIALEEEGNKRADRLVVMLEHPEQTLNVVLLMVLVAQLTSATLIGVLLEGTAGALGVVLGIVLQIVLFFVIGEVAPKTFAVQHTERAALALTPMLWFLSHLRRCAGCRACSSAWPTSCSPARASRAGPSSPRRRSAQWPTWRPTRTRSRPRNGG